MVAGKLQTYPTLNSSNPIFTDGDLALSKERARGFFEGFFADTESVVNILRWAGVTEFPEAVAFGEFGFDAGFELVSSFFSRLVG